MFLSTNSIIGNIPRFTDEEEEYKTSINQINQTLKEDKRTNYGIIPFPVDNVKSTQIQPSLTPKKVKYFLLILFIIKAGGNQVTEL